MSTVIRFENAPLIEVIAELRWNTTRDTLFQQGLPGMSIQIPDALNVADENFFARFGKTIDDEGFRSSERLVPYGAPQMPGQATVRYRRRAGTSPLLQIGSGVFTANGVPPEYTHWGDFRPVLRLGVESMLEARDPAEADSPFLLSVRYLDAFGIEFWGSSDRGHFIDGVLGFGSKLPESLQSQLHAEKPKSAMHRLTLPLADESSITIQVGEAEADGRDVVILDVLVQVQDVPADADAMMAAFENGHRVIRGLFESITVPVREIMRPVEVEEDS